MKEKIKHYIKEIIIFAIFLTIATNAISFYKSSSLTKSKYNLPPLTLVDNTTFIDDTSKPLLIHFWASWCPTCKVEASNIQTLSKEYQVVTIAVRSGEDRELKKYLSENNLDFKVLNDKEGVVAKGFNIQAYPTTFVYNKERELSFSDVGYTSTWGLKLRLWWATF